MEVDYMEIVMDTSLAHTIIITKIQTNHISSLTCDNDSISNEGDSSKKVLQGIVRGVSLLSGNNGSYSLTQLISDVAEGIVWMVTVLVWENSSEMGGAWCDITGGDIDCKGGCCIWGDIVDWCCLLMLSNYI